MMSLRKMASLGVRGVLLLMVIVASLSLFESPDWSSRVGNRFWRHREVWLPRRNASVCLPLPNILVPNVMHR
jgi:hypothetical protein